jgi:hypothetical protein
MPRVVAITLRRSTDGLSTDDVRAVVVLKHRWNDVVTGASYRALSCSVAHDASAVYSTVGIEK